MYTVVRFLPCPSIHSTRSWAWPTVSSASTRTASRSPEISVADIGDQDGASSPGARSLTWSGSDGATWTPHVSDVDSSVIGNLLGSALSPCSKRDEIVGGLGRRSHRRGPSPVQAPLTADDARSSPRKDVFELLAGRD